mmetsp:Transcript_34/g.92  ORF Transcript_34/g.92 Transcript_34/m.92 type:complete len:379 (-) Transcript_34:1259-2395(-)
MNKLSFVLLRFFQAAYCELVPSWARLRLRIPVPILEEKINQHKIWLESDGRQGARLLLFSRNLSGYDLSKYDLELVIARDCDFRRCRFVHTRPLVRDALENSQIDRIDEDEINQLVEDLRRDKHDENVTTVSKLTNVDFSYSKFEQAAFAVSNISGSDWNKLPNLTGARFIGCSGLFGADGAYFGRRISFDSTNPPAFQRWLAGTSFGDFPSWEVVSSFQRLRLLGLSNTLAIFIVFYGVVVNWYNDFVSILQARLEALGTPDSIAMIVGELSPLPTPVHFGNLLLVISVLFVTNVLYVYLDPFREGSRRVIEAYSPDDDGVFRSLSARYSNLLGRWICFVFLLFCIGYLLRYFSQRLSEAFGVYFPAGVSIFELFSG